MRTLLLKISKKTITKTITKTLIQIAKSQITIAKNQITIIKNQITIETEAKEKTQLQLMTQCVHH